MTLKFFFYHRGRVVRGLLLFTWLLNFWRMFSFSQEWVARGALTSWLFFIFLVLVSILMVVRFIPWNPAADRGFGVEDHFSKTMIAVAYMQLVMHVVYSIFDRPWPFLLFCIFLLGLIHMVNFILLYFHFRDPDPTPAAYFSRQTHSH